jgi:hypothetical protein
VEIHEDPAEDSDAMPFHRIGDDRVHFNANLPLGGSHLDIDAGFGRNRRREFEEVGASDVALGLLSRTYSTDVRLHHAPLGRVAGIVGIGGLCNSFEKFGEETLAAGTSRSGPATITGGSRSRTTRSSESPPSDAATTR